MERKIVVRLIMSIRAHGTSRREIARTRRISMESVCEVCRIAGERGISWLDVEGMSDDEVYRLFYPAGTSG